VNPVMRFVWHRRAACGEFLQSKAGSSRLGEVALALLLTVTSASAQVCTSNRYGTEAQARAIELALLSGSIDDAQAAIRAAQRTRGSELGCAETDYAPIAVSSTAPSIEAIRTVWATHAASAAQGLTLYNRCPAFGRGAGTYALGGWVARGAGLGFDVATLDALTDNFVATQYLPSRTPGTQRTWTGLYAYAERFGASANECFVPGVLGEGVATACQRAPEFCVSYASGRFRNERFVVADFDPRDGLRDGGAAFDHGWAGLMMIEAALGTATRATAQRYRSSALAAADWAVAEPAVRNHNYTARLISLLAVAYEWTGESRYREALIDKLERSLLPGQLMDDDANGEVDGVAGVRFADLRASIARVPGRYWDAHNALPWYQAINATALIDAESALRVRGDGELASRVRRHAEAALDNLAAEFATTAGNTFSAGQIAYAFARGLHKLTDPLGVSKPAWEVTLWRFWNAQILAQPGELRTATVALIAARAEGRLYLPYRQRGAVSEAATPVDARVSGLWFDPSTPGEGLTVSLIAPDRMVIAWYTYQADTSGAPLWLAADSAFDGQRFSAEVFALRGARFGALFNPADIVRTRWGRLELDFSRCDRARLTWTADAPGFGSGTRNLQRLAGISDRAC
jgi:hypothetical protein